jgi:RNA 2',3'-cyclic 3'-phosphodiesterase
MSVFLAVDLDAPTRALAAALIETQRAMWPTAKWLRTDKLHCTVVFLGHPSVDQVDAYRRGIDALAARHAPFRLRLQGAGTFVTPRAPSVLWLGIAGEVERLAALHRDSFGELRKLLTPTLPPLAQGEGDYVPHVTLARSQTSGAFDNLSRELAPFTSQAFAVSGLSLYESTSEVYRVVHAAPLGLERSHVHG